MTDEKDATNERDLFSQGFCAIPDSIMKSMMKDKQINSTIRVLFAIYWHTLRRRMYECKLSKMEIERLTGVLHQNVNRHIEKLSSFGYIKVTKKNTFQIKKTNQALIQKNESSYDSKYVETSISKMNQAMIQKNESSYDSKSAPYSRVFNSRVKDKREYSLANMSLFSLSFFSDRGFILSSAKIKILEDLEKRFSHETLTNALNLIDLYYSNTNRRKYTLAYKFEAILENLQFFLSKEKVEKRISDEEEAYLEYLKRTGQPVKSDNITGEMSIEEQEEYYMKEKK